MGNLVKMLYESINSGLDNLVESVLNEKKQEISPEDQRDNKLIRSAMKKRITGRANAKLTKEEQDALERNGWTSEGDSTRTFHTANGFVQFGDPRNKSYYSGTFNPQKVYNKHKRIENDSSIPVLDSQVRRKKYYGPNPYDYSYEWQDSPARVNLADMGRKQKERHSNDSDLDYYDETRGIKKSSKVRTGYWGDGEEVPDDRNRLNKERELLNNRKDNAYRKARTEITSNKHYIEKNKDYINQNYEEIEQKRQDTLNAIKHYKEVLASLDTEAEEYANEHNDRIKNYEDKNKKIMDKMRDEFKNRRNKNESFHIRKRTKNESFNTHKNK